MKTVDYYLKSGVIDIIPILSLVLGKTRAEVIIAANYQPTKTQNQQLEKLINQRQKGVPFAYLGGKKGFYHLDFKVNPDTLIPRPETELLIDIILDLLAENEVFEVLDLGTGSGAIAVTLADLRPLWKLTATDISAAALEVAKTNMTTKINFKKGVWLAAVAGQSFDLIVSNPPYIKENDPYLVDLKFEPKSALVAGCDGLDDLKIIIKNAPLHLKKTGFLLLEHGFDQKDEVEKLLKTNFCNIRTFSDYNHQDRAILAELK